MDHSLSQFFPLLMESLDLNLLIEVAANQYKVVPSESTLSTYQRILSDLPPNAWQPIIVTFILPEYRSFTRNPIEIYKIKTNLIATYGRLDNNLGRMIVKDSKGTYVELIGRPESMRAAHVRIGGEIISQHMLQTVFSVCLAAPIYDDPVRACAARRCLLRVATDVLNKYADCIRRSTRGAWMSIPHYSFMSFDAAYVREFSLTDRRILASDKYMMNPARVRPMEQPYVIDPDGSILASMKMRLLETNAQNEHAENLMSKGEAYHGAGHEDTSIRLCVSAVESILNKWVVSKGIIARKDGKPPTIKDLMGKFEELVKRAKMVKEPHKFADAVKRAVQFRHKLNHEGPMTASAEEVAEHIRVLREYFDLVVAQLALKA